MRKRWAMIGCMAVITLGLIGLGVVLVGQALVPRAFAGAVFVLAVLAGGITLWNIERQREGRPVPWYILLVNLLLFLTLCGILSFLLLTTTVW